MSVPLRSTLMTPLDDMPKIEIPPIDSERLRLVSITTELHQHLIDGDLKAAQEGVEFALPSDCAEIGFCKGASWVERRLRMIEKDPDQHAWMYRAIVRKDDGRIH